MKHDDWPTAGPGGRPSVTGTPPSPKRRGRSATPPGLLGEWVAIVGPPANTAQFQGNLTLIRRELDPDTIIVEAFKRYAADPDRPAWVTDHWGYFMKHRAKYLAPSRRYKLKRSGSTSPPTV